MSIAKRVVRLLKSDVNNILDCLEEPADTLKQAVRDMGELIEQERTEIEAEGRRIQTAEDARKELVQTLVEIENNIRLCFENGNEDLARLMIKRKLENIRAVQSAEKQIKKLSAGLADRQKRHKEHEVSLAGLNERIKLVPERKEDCAASSAANGLSDEEVEINFMEEKKKYQAVRSANS